MGMRNRSRHGAITPVGPDVFEGRSRRVPTRRMEWIMLKESTAKQMMFRSRPCYGDTITSLVNFKWFPAWEHFLYIFFYTAVVFIKTHPNGHDIMSHCWKVKVDQINLFCSYLLFLGKSSAGVWLEITGRRRLKIWLNVWGWLLHACSQKRALASIFSAINNWWR